MGENLTRKILRAHLVSGEMSPGKEIAIRIDQTLTQDRVVICDEHANELHRASGSMVRGRRARNCKPSPGCETSSS